MKKTLSFLLSLCLLLSLACAAGGESAVDAHGNAVNLDGSLRFTSAFVLSGADNAARRGETNLGDFWADALKWFADSGRINDYFDEDDVANGNTALAVDADHTVALWNGGNLKADLPAGAFGEEALLEVLPYPNKAAVVYLTGAQLKEALEAASQGLPYTEETAAACASFMQVSGLKYTVDTSVPYQAGEAYGDHWFRAAATGRVTVEEVNGQPLDESALYAVITNNANYNGMDSSYVFAEAKDANEASAVTTAAVREDVIRLYLTEALNLEIGAEYEAPQGRITVR